MKFSTGATVLSGIASLVAAAPYPDNSNTKQVEIKESTIICVKDTKHCFSSIKDIAATGRSIRSLHRTSSDWMHANILTSHPRKRRYQQ